jgi:hypothetical protein
LIDEQGNAGFGGLWSRLLTGDMGGTQNIVALVVGATGIAGRGACQEIDPLLPRSPRLVAQPEASCRACAM